VSAGIAPHSGDRFGYALAAAKINSGQKADLVVGAPGALVHGKAAGAVFVFFGSREGLENPEMLYPEKTGFPHQHSAKGDRYGAALAIGDFDGDGRREIAVGAPGKSRVFVVRHDFTAFSGLGGQRVPADEFGKSLAVGRLSDDGKDDLVIGSPEGGWPHAAGAVYIARGRHDGFDDPRRIREPAFDPDGGDAFGFSVAVGRFFTDAGPRLVVGAPGRFHRKGRVFVMPDLYRGGEFQEPVDFSVLELDDQIAGDQFGKVLAVGDFGTGRDDLVVGVPNKRGDFLNEGLVAFFGGHKENFGLHPKTRRLPRKSQRNLYFGSAIAPGNYNIHANLDLAIGAPGKLTPHTKSNGHRFATAAGAAWVLRGMTDEFPVYSDEPLEFYTYLDQEFAHPR
jgi:hypothetical protein